VEGADSPGRRSGRQISAADGQAVTFVELFFDLVFVFALTEITGFVSQNLDVEGAVQTALIFWLIWWAWTQWSWALNAADTEHSAIRVGTLLATAIAFLMAVSVAEAFEEDGGLWFALSYTALRLLGLGLYARVANEREGQFAAVGAFGLISMLGLAAVIVGGFADPGQRLWLWTAAVALDGLAAGIAGRFETWNIHAGHFSERHALFVIIALGESLIVSASVVTDAGRSASLLAAAAGAVGVTILLWWTYFGWLKDGLEAALHKARGSKQSALARDVYSLIHLPLIGGMVGIAAGFKVILKHPMDPADTEVLIAFGAGLGLFLGASVAAWKRASGRLLWARLCALAILLALLIIASSVSAVWILALVSLILAALVAIEGVRSPAGASQAR
jgi:low temperature requirement protein LtrA